MAAVAAVVSSVAVVAAAVSVAAVVPAVVPAAAVAVTTTLSVRLMPHAHRRAFALARLAVVVGEERWQATLPMRHSLLRTPWLASTSR